MESKEDPLWFAQQLVDTLRRDVAQKKDEIAMLLSHRALLLQAFSTPTFPAGYAPSSPVNSENWNKLSDRSIARPGLNPDEPGPSGRFSTPKIARNPPGKGRGKAPPPPQRRSPSSHNFFTQNNGGESGTSEDTHIAPTTAKQQDRRQPSRRDTASLDPPVGQLNFRTFSRDSRESSESAEIEVLPSPVHKKIKSEANCPAVNWTQQIKKRTAASSTSGSSSGSGDSISSDASTEENVSKRLKSNNPEKTTTSTVSPPKVVIQAQALSSDAPPEEHFDWEVLGIAGPWSADRSSSLLANSAWSQLLKQHTVLPCQFKDMDEYRSSFEGYIFEECKALLNCAWEEDQNALPGTGQNVAEIEGVPEKNGHSLWQFRPMYPSDDDPFKYVEAELIDGSDIRLDISEVVLLTHGDTKCLAVVTLTNYKGALLRTRLGLPARGGQCNILRMTNMVTLKRQYVSLCRVTELWHPLQQQLLNPLESSNVVISTHSGSSTEDVKVRSTIKTVLAWKNESLFNKKQLGTIEALLSMQQGFLLVQGPPGTGKTSTIVGMISALRIEEPRAKILVCASSNAAVDEIVSRLMHHMLDISGKLYTPERGALIRLGVEKSIQPACLPVSLDKVAQSNTGASNPSTIKSKTIAGASIVCCTISGSGHQHFDEIHRKFDVLIIDEAAQAQESEVLIALQRVRGRCVMVGDPCQLPAVVMQRPGKAYGRSLFERMQEAGRPVFLMTTQYRMHPLISEFPAATFYGGRLKDSAYSRSMVPIFKEKTQVMGVALCGYSFKLGTYCFLDVTWGVEHGELVGHSISNFEEAEVVATVVQGAVRSLKEGISPNIGVITPYLAQRSLILENLQKYGIDDDACEVNTVDGFQGREKDIVILSCVRAQAEHGLGFVSDLRRMNVALTRAKHSLIIVGHAETLRRQSPVWNALIEDASSRELYQVLSHKIKTKMPQARQEVAGGQRASVSDGTPQHTNQRKFDQGGGTILKTGHQPTRKVFEQGTHLPSGVVEQPRFEQAHGAGQDLHQRRSSEHRNASTEAGRRSSHIRFEEDGVLDSAPSSHTSSKETLRAICDLAMSPGALVNRDKIKEQGGLKRRASDDGTGYDQAERSSHLRGRQLIVKLEDQEYSRRASGNPAVAAVRAVPPAPEAPTVPSAPSARRMRGQIDSNWKGSSWHTPPWVQTSAAEGDRQDTGHSNLDHAGILGSGPVEAATSYGRDNSTAMHLSEDRNGEIPRDYRGGGRERGSSRPKGNANRRDVLDREQSHIETQEARNGNRHRKSPVRKQSFRGRFRGRGKWSKSSAR